MFEYLIRNHKNKRTRCAHSGCNIKLVLIQNDEEALVKIKNKRERIGMHKLAYHQRHGQWPVWQLIPFALFRS